MGTNWSGWPLILDPKGLVIGEVRRIQPLFTRIELTDPRALREDNLSGFLLARDEEPVIVRWKVCILQKLVC